MEYLKIAQDLEMYGVNYFAIRVSWVAWGSCFPASVICISCGARRAGRWHFGDPSCAEGRQQLLVPRAGSLLGAEGTGVHG